MIQYACDTCAAIKRPGEEWILGFAAENVGLTAARREVAIAPEWDDRRACELLAVHFCSEQCKDDYVAKLFRAEIVQPEITIETTSLKPGRKVVTMRRRSHSPSKSSRKRKRA